MPVILPEALEIYSGQVASLFKEKLFSEREASIAYWITRRYNHLDAKSVCAVIDGAKKKMRGR